MDRRASIDCRAELVPDARGTAPTTPVEFSSARVLALSKAAPPPVVLVTARDFSSAMVLFASSVGAIEPVYEDVGRWDFDILDREVSEAEAGRVPGA